MWKKIFSKKLKIKNLVREIKQSGVHYSKIFFGQQRDHDFIFHEIAYLWKIFAPPPMKFPQCHTFGRESFSELGPIHCVMSDIKRRHQTTLWFLLLQYPFGGGSRQISDIISRQNAGNSHLTWIQFIRPAEMTQFDLGIQWERQQYSPTVPHHNTGTDANLLNVHSVKRYKFYSEIWEAFLQIHTLVMLVWLRGLNKFFSTRSSEAGS